MNDDMEITVYFRHRGQNLEQKARGDMNKVIDLLNAAFIAASAGGVGVTTSFNFDPIGNTVVVYTDFVSLEH